MKKQSILLLVFFLGFAGAVSADALDASLIEQHIFRISNEERAKRDLRLYDYDPKLAVVAVIHSSNMAAQNFFSHTDRIRRSPAARVEEYYPEILGGVGENIAYQYGNSEEAVAAALMRAWMNSAGHRANILSRKYNRIGIGVFQRGERFYATQKFIDAVVIVPEQTPQSVPFGEEHSFTFSFIGSFNPDDITVFLRFADRSVRFPVPGSSKFYTGTAPLQPVWLDEETFSLSFTFDKGRGIYTFLFGSGGRFHVRGYEVRVE